MKRIDRFIIRSFVGPFLAILLVVIFVLMMQFLWLYIDELVGKGLSFKIILEFLGWGAATLLPLSLPLATLLASMMTLGTLGENNELHEPFVLPLHRGGPWGFRPFLLVHRVRNSG